MHKYFIDQINMPQISIICPVYNAACYLARGLASIEAQTLSDWELIAVDDGSTDLSLSYLERFAASEPRMHVITQPNSGPGAARNKGLQMAQGEFVWFFDVDDEADPDLLKKAHDAILKANADLCVWGLKIRNVTSEEELLFPDRIYNCNSNIEMTSYLTEQVIAKRHGNGFVHNKLFRRSVIVDNLIEIPEDMRVMEDEVFNQLYLRHCNRIVCIEQALYIYYLSHPGNSRQRYLSNYYDIIKRVHYEFLSTASYFKIEDPSLSRILNTRSMQAINRYITDYLYHPDSKLGHRDRTKLIFYLVGDKMYQEVTDYNKKMGLLRSESKLYLRMINAQNERGLHFVVEGFKIARKIKNYFTKP